MATEGTDASGGDSDVRRPPAGQQGHERGGGFWASGWALARGVGASLSTGTWALVTLLVVGLGGACAFAGVYHRIDPDNPSRTSVAGLGCFFVLAFLAAICLIELCLKWRTRQASDLDESAQHAADIMAGAQHRVWIVSGSAHGDFYDRGPAHEALRKAVNDGLDVRVIVGREAASGSVRAWAGDNKLRLRTLGVVPRKHFIVVDGSRFRVEREHPLGSEYRYATAMGTARFGAQLLEADFEALWTRAQDPAGAAANPAKPS